MIPTAHLLIDGALAPTLAIRTVAESGAVIALTSSMLLDLEAELGSVDQTWRWIVGLASETGRPVFVNMIVNKDGDSQTYVIGPQDWPDDRIKGWAAGLLPELEASFGPATGVSQL